MKLVRFCDVTEGFARKEGEGDISLEYWQKEHKWFFSVQNIFLAIWKLSQNNLRLLSRCKIERVFWHFIPYDLLQCPLLAQSGRHTSFARNERKLRAISRSD